ncbi:peptidylprolyl isomerase [Arsenicitalea aurantiaca]|uniref:peptidylprolyl isomerase n=1 Tax=Arsenicitalea aurantiaca TaxID=1783274 RepID=UPI0024530F5C|nr:peptidylprolyl isomerase [Arsenicitalea aurantiaca]
MGMTIMVRMLAALALSLTMMMGMAVPASAASVVASVNEQPITDLQLNARLRLYELEGRSGRNAARDELINEALQMQEARRLGIEVTDAEVSQAILNVARNLRVSPENLREILSSRGVNISTLQDRMRAAIAWSKVTQAAVVPRVQISDVELEQRAVGQVSEANSFDYILKEVLFIMPGGQGNASARTAEANRYRSSFAGCDTAVQRSLNFTDAAVRDIGRRHATQLPEAIASELAGINVGGITRPRVVENGVSMLAVCQKAQARDTTFIKNQLRQEVGNEQLRAEADKYLAEVRSRSNIVIR